METIDILEEQKSARVMLKKPPKTEIIYDKPPEEQNPAAYPIINDPKKATIGKFLNFWCLGVNTDISAPTIFMKQYKVNEGTDIKMIKPMLIDSSIIDSIVTEKNSQDNQSGKYFIKNFFSISRIFKESE